MFCNCKNISSKAWVGPERGSTCETNKSKVNAGNVKNEQTGVKYHRIPFHRRTKDRNKSKKSKPNVMNIRNTAVLSETGKENVPQPSPTVNTCSDVSKPFSNAQWPQLKSPTKTKKNQNDIKPDLHSTETQTDVFNVAEMYPLWNTREIVSQISEDVSFLRQNRITQGTQTEDITIMKENHSESMAHLAGMLTLAQIHKTYADVVQQENGRSDQGTKFASTETSTELKTFFKLKGTRRSGMHKHSHRSLEVSLQKMQLLNHLEESTLVDITEIYLSGNETHSAGEPQDFRSLLQMLANPNEGVKINQLHENQPALLYVLSSAKHMSSEAHCSYDISASTRNYFILHSDNCMLNCATVDQLMYGYSFQEGSRHQIKLYNQSLQKKNIKTLTIIDHKLQELGCQKATENISDGFNEMSLNNEKRFQHNSGIKKECITAETVLLNEALQYQKMDTLLTQTFLNTTQKESTVLEEAMCHQAEVIATEGLDLRIAFCTALELWGQNKPRMPYTKMLATHSIQNKLSHSNCSENMSENKNERSVPKWLIVPLQKEHQFLLDSVNGDHANACSVYYESQTCKSNRYIIKIHSNDSANKQHADQRAL